MGWIHTLICLMFDLQIEWQNIQKFFFLFYFCYNLYKYIILVSWILVALKKQFSTFLELEQTTLSQELSKTIRRYRYLHSEVAVKIILWLGSPQHEELYKRVITLGRLRTPALKARKASVCYCTDRKRCVLAKCFALISHALPGLRIPISQRWRLKFSNWKAGKTGFTGAELE